MCEGGGDQPASETRGVPAEGTAQDQKFEGQARWETAARRSQGGRGLEGAVGWEMGTWGGWKPLVVLGR